MVLSGLAAAAAAATVRRRHHRRLYIVQQALRVRRGYKKHAYHVGSRRPGSAPLLRQ